MIKDKLKKILTDKNVPAEKQTFWLEALNYLPIEKLILLCDILAKMPSEEVEILTENLEKKVAALKDLDRDLWNSIVEEENKFIFQNNA